MGEHLLALFGVNLAWGRPTLPCNKKLHKIQFNNGNSDNRESDEGGNGRATGFRRARRRPDRMADNPPEILVVSVAFSFPVFGGALASVRVFF